MNTKLFYDLIEAVDRIVTTTEVAAALLAAALVCYFAMRWKRRRN